MFFQAFDFQGVFPSLVDFHWTDMGFPEEVLAESLENISQVTRITRGKLQNSPFEILSHLPRAKEVSLTCALYEGFNLQPFELASLTTLKLNCNSNNWTLEELQAVFKFFPNLVNLFLELRGLADDFDEQVTMESLRSKQSSIVHDNMLWLLKLAVWLFNKIIPQKNFSLEKNLLFLALSYRMF
jgi:hypothetical protein